MNRTGALQWRTTLGRTSALDRTTTLQRIVALLRACVLSATLLLTLVLLFLILVLILILRECHTAEADDRRRNETLRFQCNFIHEATNFRRIVRPSH